MTVIKLSNVVLCVVSIYCTVTSVAASADIVSGVSATQLFELAGRAERANDTDSAQNIYRALAQDPNMDIRNEARFRHAQLLRQMHRLADAALFYRAILDEKPDASRVRLELATVLAQMGDLSAARHELRQAQAGGLPPNVVHVVNQYVTALRSMKSWGGSLELALAPDSNINRATDAKTLDTVIVPLTLSDDARQRSGLGFKGSGQLYLRAPLGKYVTLVPRVSGQGTFYRASQFNDVSGSAQVGLEWRLKGDRITPSAGYTWRWYGGDLYGRTQSLSLNWIHPSGKRAQINADFGVNRVRYARSSFQDGMIYNAEISYERAFTARSGASITLSANRQTARDANYSTASGDIGVVYWHDFGKFTLFGYGNIRRLEADKRLFLFPERRKEWYFHIGGGSVFRQIHVAGFSPVVRVAFERNQSSVSIYDFRRVVTDVGITRAF